MLTCNGARLSPHPVWKKARPPPGHFGDSSVARYPDHRYSWLGWISMTMIFFCMLQEKVVKGWHGHCYHKIYAVFRGGVARANITIIVMNEFQVWISVMAAKEKATWYTPWRNTSRCHPGCACDAVDTWIELKSRKGETYSTSSGGNLFW
jgi:hypothetical protein